MYYVTNCINLFAENNMCAVIGYNIKIKLLRKRCKSFSCSEIGLIIMGFTQKIEYIACPQIKSKYNK